MFLGLDLGTTNIKALAVEADGRVVAEGTAAVGRTCTPDGGVEQDIEVIWRSTCMAIRQAVGTLAPDAIEAVGVSSQGGAIAWLDADDRPLGPVISWLDGRGVPWDKRFTEELGEDFLGEHLGRRRSAITPGQILRLRHESPEAFARVRQVAFVGDAVVGRLCGRRAHDPTSLSIAMLLNPSLGKADPDVLTRLSLREDQLPDLLAATAPVGNVTPRAAHETGLPPGIPVSPAVHDQYAASLGAGSVGDGDVSLGTGTAWVLVANSAKLAPPATPHTFVCPHPVPGLFGQMLSMTNGGSALEWAISLAGKGSAGREEVDAALESVPPGSDGLRFWPLLTLGGGDTPFERPGGRLAGITFSHGPNHLIRAVVEGLACELARHLGDLTAAGVAVERLAMSGAAAASRVTPGIIADVTNCPVACIEQPSLSAFGASVIAQTLIQPGIDLAALARRLAPASRTIRPGGNRAAYAGLLAEYLEPFVSHTTTSANA
jgi:sugar (pentulose or hexulose) kinase